MNTATAPTAADIQAALRQLYVERALAELADVAHDDGRMADLLEDIHAHESALAGMVVTEIAILRAELSGSLRG
jgi:hypothetical protein